MRGRGGGARFWFLVITPIMLRVTDKLVYWEEAGGWIQVFHPPILSFDYM